MFLSSVGACHIDGIDKSRLSPPPYLSLSLHTLLHSVYYFCTATPPLLLLPLLLTTPLLPPLLSIALHFHTIFCLFILVLARKKFDFFFDIFGCSYTCFRIFFFCWYHFLRDAFGRCRHTISIITRVRSDTRAANHLGPLYWFENTRHKKVNEGLSLSLSACILSLSLAVALNTQTDGDTHIQLGEKKRKDGGREGKKKSKP